MLHINSKQDALDKWNIYVSTMSSRVEWNGDIETGKEGLVSDKSLTAITDRINFYRLMCGISPVTHDKTYDSHCQKCAMVLSANPTWALSHTLPSTLKFYSKEAALAAAKSCIDRYDEGVKSVTDMMRDFGMTSLNQYVGHRRWMLRANLKSVSIGAIPTLISNPASLCVYVMGPIDQTKNDGDIAYPPAGYAPMAIIPERWSFSPKVGDVSKAKVTFNGIVQKIITQNTSAPGSAIIWKPILPFNVEDTNTVLIENILVNGLPVSYSYDVIRFKP